MGQLTVVNGNPINQSVSSYAAGNAVTLNTSTQTNVGWVDVTDRNGDAVFELLVAGQTLTSLQVTRSCYAGGHTAGNQVAVQVDSELDMPTTFVKEAIPLSSYLSVAGTRIQLKVNCDGAAEIGIQAKSNAGTLQIVQVNLPPTSQAA